MNTKKKPLSDTVKFSLMLGLAYFSVSLLIYNTPFQPTSAVNINTPSAAAKVPPQTEDINQTDPQVAPSTYKTKEDILVTIEENKTNSNANNYLTRMPKP